MLEYCMDRVTGAKYGPARNKGSSPRWRFVDMIMKQPRTDEPDSRGVGRQKKVEIIPRFKVYYRHEFYPAFEAEVQEAARSASLMPLARRIEQQVQDTFLDLPNFVRVEYQWTQGEKPIVCVLVVVPVDSGEEIHLNAGAQYLGENIDEVAEAVVGYLVQKLGERIRELKAAIDGKRHDQFASLDSLMSGVASPQSWQS